MRRWIERRLTDRGEVVGLSVVLDPDRLLNETEINELLGDAGAVAEDWLSLRREYEQQGRWVGQGAVELLVRSDVYREARDLPFDIEQNASVSVVQLPLGEPARSLVLSLPEALQSHALGAAAGPDPIGSIMQELWGVQLPAASGRQAAELADVIDLRTDPTVPSEVWHHVQRRVNGSWARALASEPPDVSLLQEAWVGWLSDEIDADSGSLIETLGPKLTTLFHVGLLKPVESDRDVPSWAAAGVVQPGWLSLARVLFDEPPLESNPTDFAEWLRLAEWWGEVRLAISLGSPESAELANESWARWDEWDASFRQFLHNDFGKMLSSVAGRPQVVSRIAPFLARRLREHKAERVLLVVFDGMGFPHWSLMRRELELQVTDASGVLTMAPSLTPISRQAIFAGALPLTFAEYFENTSHEGDLWRSFWEGEGVPVGAVEYYNMEGDKPGAVPAFGQEKVVGMVVRAIDELMHTSEMFGEAQFAENVRIWLRHGFVRSLVERASEAGFEIWFTADHGSLEVIPQGRPREGLAVDRPGTRVNLYKTKALRSQSTVEGDAWDPPGMPADGPYPLFPWGRNGMRHDVKITHGGLSFDEMIVPFVRVEP